ncbi:NADP-dependent oxidoreductase [Pseudonocardia xishanensis]|uniref:NADP-dependent oxidoreductase n=1 Tax=Pseudonocardia xishanensis TaxID=630995 RepID=A0ABP8RG49_9PSEU
MPLAAQFSEYGTTDELTVVEVPDKSPGPGQVRLAVRAAGVNPIDWKLLSGAMRAQMLLQLPAGLGSDVAGVVDQLGEGVSTWQVGDEVLGSSASPAFAQSAVADAGALVAKPAGLPWEVAGGIAGAGATAWTVIDDLALAAGETLLIHAAAGGVGTMAAQVALARGARVIGTAGPDKHELLRSLGVEPVTYGEGLADRVRALSPAGVDAVLDASGRGEIPVSIELAGGPERVLTLVAFDQAASGVRIHVGGGGADSAPAVAGIVGLIQEGRLRVPVARTFPLADVAAALELSRAGHVAGKLVVLPV